MVSDKKYSDTLKMLEDVKTEKQDLLAKLEMVEEKLRNVEIKNEKLEFRTRRRSTARISQQADRERFKTGRKNRSFIPLPPLSS